MLRALKIFVISPSTDRENHRNQDEQKTHLCGVAELQSQLLEVCTFLENSTMSQWPFLGQCGSRRTKPRSPWPDDLPLCGRESRLCHHRTLASAPWSLWIPSCNSAMCPAHFNHHTNANYYRVRCNTTSRGHIYVPPPPQIYAPLQFHTIAQTPCVTPHKKVQFCMTVPSPPTPPHPTHAFFVLFFVVVFTVVTMKYCLKKILKPPK